jgi:hypothetical protein
MHGKASFGRSGPGSRLSEECADLAARSEMKAAPLTEPSANPSRSDCRGFFLRDSSHWRGYVRMTSGCNARVTPDPLQSNQCMGNARRHR